jgi:hypothetical protein
MSSSESLLQQTQSNRPAMRQESSCKQYKQNGGRIDDGGDPEPVDELHRLTSSASAWVGTDRPVRSVLPRASCSS